MRRERGASNRSFRMGTFDTAIACLYLGRSSHTTTCCGLFHAFSFEVVFTQMSTFKRAVEDASAMVCELMRPVGFDEIKRRQLIDLAICNGTYRPDQQHNSTQAIYAFIAPTGDNKLSA
jgi:hypothetical protein